jgi:hypothetical protein
MSRSFRDNGREDEEYYMDGEEYEEEDGGVDGLEDAGFVEDEYDDDEENYNEDYEEEEEEMEGEEGFACEDGVEEDDVAEIDITG